jgi:hypothetical protein
MSTLQFKYRINKAPIDDLDEILTRLRANFNRRETMQIIRETVLQTGRYVCYVAFDLTWDDNRTFVPNLVIFQLPDSRTVDCQVVYDA